MKKKDVVNLSASVRQRLLNLAAERKEDFGLVLSRYGLERFLYRLSVSPHRDSFVLKGALLLQVWTEETYRPTRDLDLLGTGMSNVSYRKVFSEVCAQEVEDDGLSFPTKTIRVERIREEEAYEGVRVRLVARLGTGMMEGIPRRLVLLLANCAQGNLKRRRVQNGIDLFGTRGGPHNRRPGGAIFPLGGTLDL